MSNRYVSGATALQAIDQGNNVMTSGGFFPIDFPDPTTMPDDCRINVKNLDTTAGKRLTGYVPPEANTRLYPGQSLGVTTQNGQWVVIQDPGRFKITAACCTVFVADAAHGGNDNNDGLDPARPVLHNYTAVSIIQKDFDTQYITPIAALIGGSVFVNDPFFASGQPTGGNLIQLSVYNGQACILCDDTPAVMVGDNGELNIKIDHYSASNSLFLQGNRNNHIEMASGVGQHNNGLFDQSGTIIIVGSGPNCSAYFFDGPTPGASIADGFIACGTFGYLWNMDEGGGRFTLSGQVRTAQWGTPAVWPTCAGLLRISGTNDLILGGPGNQWNGATWASIGASVVNGNARLVTNGIAIPGLGAALQGGIISTAK